MFTGIIETVGTVTVVSDSNLGRTLLIECPSIIVGVKVGDSIAVNGTCLTVIAVDETGFTTEAVAETLEKTSMGKLMTGDRVNLERPMHANGRFDGHIVQGHVDGTGTVLDVVAEGDAVRITIATSKGLARYLVEKGSVTVDGISLTIAAVGEESFQIALISHTLSETVMQYRQPGDMVNLEVDVIAKYVERLLKPSLDEMYAPRESHDGD